MANLCSDWLLVGRYGVRIPGRGDRYLKKMAQTGSGAHTVPYSLGTGKGKVQPRASHEGPDGE